MDLSIITKSSKQLSRAISRNSPTILTALGVAGLISTVILAIKATPQAEEALYQEAMFQREEWSRQTGEIEEACPTDTFTPIEVIELTWRFYIPTVIMGTATIACMIGSNHINLRRNAALASLFSITETALKEYQAKVVETIGEKKEELLRGEIAQDKINANPPESKTIIITAKGDCLFYDAFSARYFESNVENVRYAENAFNQRLLRNGWLSINEFYDELGLEPIELGDEMGWIAERTLLEIKFSSKLTKDEKPCVVLDYMVRPIHI